jgi:pimeloyl-ACP methyl ester carboxylesterase
MRPAHRRPPQLLLAALVLVAACGSKVPARIETINGHDVEIATAGTTGPTVVFEAGLGDDWTSWDDVASQVARHARVFAYSRPGYGASSPAISSRDPRTIVEELRALLAYEVSARGSRSARMSFLWRARW